LILADVVHPHRLEGTGTDMQGDMPELHAAFAQRIEQGIVEMQARSRRGNGADLAREHGLVTLGIVRAGLALDVGRQRQAPGVQQPVLQRFRQVEAQLPEAGLVAGQHLGLAASIERDPAAGLRRLADAELRARLVVRQQALDQDFHAPACGLVAEQPRRNHPGVVEDQQIARLQQGRQVAHLQIRQRGIARRHQQQPTGRAFRQRRLRNQRFGQVVMEIGLLQGRRNASRARIVRPLNARTWSPG